MKVKTRKAFKRSQGLQSPEAPKGCVCVRTRVTRHAAWSRGEIHATATKSDGTKAYVSNIPQTSNRPPKPKKLPKNKKSYAAAVRPDSEARQCKEQNRCTMLGLSPPWLTQSPAGKGSRKNLSIQLDCTAYESEGFRPTQSVWSLL